MSWRAFRSAEPGSSEARVWRIAATLMPVLILNNLFATRLRSTRSRQLAGSGRLDQRGQLRNTRWFLINLSLRIAASDTTRDQLAA